MIESYIGLRKDIVGLIEGTNLNVLDVGCATGTTGAYLKEKGIARYVMGVEYSPEMAAVAEGVLDGVVVGDLENRATLRQLNPDVQFDLIICGDILEHLRNPEAVLGWLKELGTKKVKIIISVPNMQHAEAIFNLAFRGYWPKNDRGIFDRTHVQVFTKKNLMELLRINGLKAVKLRRNYRFRDRVGSNFPLYFTKIFFTTFFKNYFTFQYIVLAEAE